MADREVSAREHPFASFCEAVSDLLDQQAAEKGYHGSGLTGPKPLYEFVSERPTREAR